MTDDAQDLMSRARQPLAADVSSLTFPGAVYNRFYRNTILILSALLLASCSEHHSYDYLPQQYPVTAGDKLRIQNGGVTLTRPLRNEDSLWLPDYFSVSVSKTSVTFEPADPRSAQLLAFEVPANAIHSCSYQCGSGNDFVLILEAANTQIRIEDAYELIEWCWFNQLPMLSSNARRDWLHNGAALPSEETLAKSLVNREAYDEKAKRACQGY